MIDLDELTRLEKAATPGRWNLLEWRDLVAVGGAQAAEAYTKGDGELLVALRNAAPALIAELRVLRKVRDAAVRVLSQTPRGGYLPYWFGEHDDLREALDEAEKPKKPGV